jgi:hypothetical protein
LPIVTVPPVDGSWEGVGIGLLVCVGLPLGRAAFVVALETGLVVGLVDGLVVGTEACVGGTVVAATVVRATAERATVVRAAGAAVVVLGRALMLIVMTGFAVRVGTAERLTATRSRLGAVAGVTAADVAGAEGATAAGVAEPPPPPTGAGTDRAEDCARIALTISGQASSSASITGRTIQVRRMAEFSA